MRVLGHCRGDKLAGRSLHWISVRERHEKYELFTGVKSSSGACDSPCPINAARGNELNTVNWVGNNFFSFLFQDVVCIYLEKPSQTPYQMYFRSLVCNHHARARRAEQRKKILGLFCRKLGGPWTPEKKLGKVTSHGPLQYS